MAIKVIFDLSPVDAPISIINFYKSIPERKKQILDIHPEIEKMCSSPESLKDYFYNFRKDHQNEMLNKLNQIQNSWDKISQEYFTKLSEVLETTLPDKVIQGFIYEIPFCPRNLQKWNFFLYYDYDINNLLRLTAHEILHFLYFKKWGEVFPGSDKKTFERPHLIWKLSEILAVVILHDKRFSNIITQNLSSNYYFISLEILQFFNDLYNAHLENKISFESFLKLAFEEAEKKGL